MTATRASWRQAVWAVLAGSFLASIATLLAMIPLFWIGVPLGPPPEATGRGWPWRIDGVWSLVADLGPLLVAGGLFAYFAEGITARRTEVDAPRLPIALAAAALGWVSLGGVTNAGVLGASGLASFIALVVVTREMSGRRRRPWRWTAATAWAALVLVLVLIAASTSYAVLHPLSSGSAELQSMKDGHADVSTWLRNEGRADVTVLRVTVPDVRTRALTGPSDSYEYDPDDPDLGMIPITGKTIVRGESRDLTLRVPARCPPSRIVDRVQVRLRVLGRTVDQVVRLESPVPIGCA